MDKMKVCHDVLRAENQPFADERDKKKFLDLVEEQKKEKELDIFAFCVTDEECHFLVLGDSEGKLAEAADAVVKNFAAHYSAHHKGEEVQLVRPQDPYDRDRTEAGSETGRLLVEQSWGIPETAAPSEGHGKYRRDTEVPG